MGFDKRGILTATSLYIYDSRKPEKLNPLLKKIIFKILYK